MIRYRLRTKIFPGEIGEVYVPMCMRMPFQATLNSSIISSQIKRRIIEIIVSPSRCLVEWHKHAVHLKMLRDASPKLRKQIMHHCGKDFLNCACECVKNVLKGNVPLTSSQKQKIISTQKQVEGVSVEENFEEEKDRHNTERRFPRRINNSDFIASRRATGVEWIKLRK